MDSKQLYAQWETLQAEITEYGPGIFRDFRSSFYFTQKKAAEALGISPNYVALIETRQMPMTIRVLRRIIEYEQKNLSR